MVKISDFPLSPTASGPGKVREAVRTLAAEFLERREPTAWFEKLYAVASNSGLDIIPWADFRPNPYLLDWLSGTECLLSQSSALVVGCGLGDDAEELTRHCRSVTAFDIAATSIALAKDRFPGTSVDYQTADLLCPPTDWRGRFEFVFESYTLQVLPESLRVTAIESLASCVAQGGLLLLITRGREASEAVAALPWPLSRAELSGLEDSGMDLIGFDDFLDRESPPVRRFRAVYRRR